MMLNPFVVIYVRQAQFPRFASVASEMIFVHPILHVIAIAVAFERQRAAMIAAHRWIAVVKLRLLT